MRVRDERSFHRQKRNKVTAGGGGRGGGKDSQPCDHVLRLGIVASLMLLMEAGNKKRSKE